MSKDMTNQTLALELISMAKADQAMRNQAMEDPSAWDGSLDKRHTARMKKIVREYGWPDIPLVGIEASNAAWLLVQHADHDPTFQKECLILMKALPEEDILQPNIAYLEDRILTAEGKPQLYGTQFQGTGKSLRPRPIADEKSVDRRRKSMGLGTMAEYTKLMQKEYGEKVTTLK